MGLLLFSPSLLTIPPSGPGGRLLQLPQPEQPTLVTMRWRTSVLKTHNGHETRIASATKMLENYELDYLLDELQSRFVRAELAEAPQGPHLLPLHHDAMVARTAVTGPSIIVTSTTQLDWIDPGQRVLVLNELTGDYFMAVIQSTSATTLTLDIGPTSGTFPAGVTSVCPLWAVLLDDNVLQGHYPDNLSKLKLAARRLTSDTDWGTGAPSITSFDGYSVLDRRPLMDGVTSQEQSEGGIRITDYGAKVESYFSRVIGEIQRAHAFFIDDASERQWWRAFLHLIRGRQKAFLMPTWRDDLVVSTQPTSTSLLVFRGFHADTWFQGSQGQRLWIEMSDGTFLMRKASSSANQGNGTDQLVLTSAIDTSGANPDIVKISLLELVRSATDLIPWEKFAAHSIIKLPVVTCQE